MKKAILFVIGLLFICVMGFDLNPNMPIHPMVQDGGCFKWIAFTPTPTLAPVKCDWCHTYYYPIQLNVDWHNDRKCLNPENGIRPTPTLTRTIQQYIYVGGEKP